MIEVDLHWNRSVDRLLRHGTERAGVFRRGGERTAGVCAQGILPG